MSKKEPGTFWHIEGRDGLTSLFDVAVRSSQVANVVEILKRLAARHLNQDDLIACSMKRSHGSQALDVCFPEPRSTGRHSISIGSGPWYTASIWTESELVEAGIPILRRGL